MCSQNKTTIRSSDGAPVASATATMTVGPRGPVLLQDTTFLDVMQHFDRERIPERVVHAKGAGAFGFFEVTHDITRYTKAVVFSEVGKKTPIAVRFSQEAGNSGSADTNRDLRGFAIKFYTEEGNWDLVGNNSPIFFIRDPILFPMLVHSQQRNRVNNTQDMNSFWDFASLRPETTHQMLMMYSDRGIPDGYRHMHGYGSHTFKLVNSKNQLICCKFHYRTEQGIKNLSPEDGQKLAGCIPDYSIRDLHNSIEEKNFPSWTLYIQVMTLEQASTFHWDPFDVTKVWPHKDHPLIPVGRIVLDRNPKNYFNDVEQLAFCPGNLIPGIEASLDRLLQGRLFTYKDTQLHRLGTNNRQIPVNCPYRIRPANYERDGQMNVRDNQDGTPSYYPNSFGGPEQDPTAAISPFSVSGQVASYDSRDEDNFSQPALFWNNVLKPDERERLANNIGSNLNRANAVVKVVDLLERVVKMFANVDSDLAVKIATSMNMQAKSCL